MAMPKARATTGESPAIRIPVLSCRSDLALLDSIEFRRMFSLALMQIVSHRQ
jgi:hypothetical protein